MIERNCTQWIATAQELFDIQSKIKKLEEKQSELRIKLKELSQDATSYYGSFKFLRYEQKGRVQYNLIPELKNIDLDAFRAPNLIMWRLDLIAPLIND